MTIYYIDNNRGLDINDGLTKDTAWKSLTKISGIAAQAGDKFLLADDSVWTPDIAERIVAPNTWQGTSKKPVTIGKYNYRGIGSSAKPTIKWNRKIQPNEWTYSAPNNAWVFNSPSSPGPLCLLRLNATWSASYVDVGLPLASIDGRYFVSGNNLYLYAPSDTDPTTYYGEVLLSLNSGYFTFSTNRRHVVIEDIHFEETSTAVLAFSDTASTETVVTARRLSGKTVSGLIRAATGGTTGQLRAFFHDNSIEDWGACAIQSFTAAGEGLRELKIYNNRINDGLHCYSQGAIYIQSRSTGMRTKIFKNHISNVRWGTRDKIFDGCAIYTETVSGGVDVFSNLIENCYTAFQDNSGRETRWFGNVIRNCWGIVRVSDEESVGSTNFSFYNNTCIVGNPIQPSFGSGYTDNAIRVYKPSGTAVVLNIRNNIIYNQWTSTRAAILTPQVSWSGSLDNNIIYGYQDPARREFSPFTLETGVFYIVDPKLKDDCRTDDYFARNSYGLLTSPIRDIHSKFMTKMIGAVKDRGIE